MQFDSFTLMLLSRPPDAPDLTDEQVAVLQDGHLAHLASLHDLGALVAAGPLLVDRDHALRGIGLFTVAPEEAADLMAGDPSVQAGWMVPSFQTWLCPTGAIGFTPTRFPRSAAEAMG